MRLSKCFYPVVAGVLSVMAPSSLAQNIYVNNFGASGWFSDDTRANNGSNLIGLNYTHPEFQGGEGSEASDLAIGSFLGFTSDFAGASSTWQGLGALRIYSGSENAAKSTLSIINVDSGFASASEVLSSDFYATYRAYNVPSATSRSVAFRLGIQSTKWEESQLDFSPTRTGEGSWDLILTYNDPNTPNEWTQHTVSATEGTWSLYFQAGSTYFGDRPTEKKTLAEWAADETYGELLFGSGAIISNVQFGLGSSARNNNTYIDFLKSNLLFDGSTINFVDSSVEVQTAAPSSGNNEFTSSGNAVVQLTSGGATDAQVSVSNSGTGGEKTVVEVGKDAEVEVESLNVGGGGVLSGGGLITASEGISIASGGVHAPGFSPGVQVLVANYNNSGELEIELGGRTGATGASNAPVAGEFDQLLVLGAVDLSDLILNIKAYNDFSPVVGDVFRILYFSGPFVGLEDQIILMNEGFAAPVEFALHLNLDGTATFLDQSGLNYIELEVTAVPEPSVYGMMLVSLAVGVVLMRRKARSKAHA